jgi:hypothetical protein
VGKAGERTTVRVVCVVVAGCSAQVVFFIDPIGENYYRIFYSVGKFFTRQLPRSCVLCLFCATHRSSFFPPTNETAAPSHPVFSPVSSPISLGRSNYRVPVSLSLPPSLSVNNQKRNNFSQPFIVVSIVIKYQISILNSRQSLLRALTHPRQVPLSHSCDSFPLLWFEPAIVTSRPYRQYRSETIQQ